MRLPWYRALIFSSVLSLSLAACGGDEGGVSNTKVDSGTVEVDTTEGEISETPDVTTADSGEADAGKSEDGGTAPEDTGSVDAGTPDAGPEDIEADAGADTEADAGVEPDGGGSGDTGGGCPGADGCECKANSECGSGICMNTHEGKRCAQKCTDTCPTGYACKDIGDGSPLFYCVSAQLTLCSPCQFHSDCQVNGVNSLCLDYGADGKFCGSPCAKDSDCPTDYTCGAAKDGAGKEVMQCKRKDDTNGKPMACGCSDWAVAKGLETECSLTNDNGTCKAKRKCTAKGLTKCEAKTPNAELCNTVDDDCDGKTDNLAKDFPCTIKSFADEGSKTSCNADGDCNKTGEACDTTSGTCKKLIGACPGKATCSDKGALLCTGAATPKVEICNGIDDDCDSKTDEDFTFDAGAAGKLAVGASCGVGACAGGKVVCDGTAKTKCDSLSKATKETCDGIDNDCNGKQDDAACEDNDACTEDVCDATAKTCSNKPKVDCDDKDACTKDTCDKQTAKCTNAPHFGSCDDGNACSIGDKCGKHPVSGKHTCLPGTDKPKCDDNNPCTDDLCDTQKGCQNKANSATQPCYTGDAKTKNVGTCKEGKKLCKDGKLGTTCVDEVLPAAKEICDGKDHTCNGVKDEGCAPKDVKVTFSNAHVAGKSGKMNVEVLVGQGGAVGQAAGGKYSLRFGFLAWLQALTK